MGEVRLRDDKSLLRRDYREARASFARESGARVRASLEHNISRLIRDLDTANLQVAVYRPREDEPQFEVKPVSAFYYPRMEGQKLRLLRPAKGFTKGPLGIEEPVEEGAKEINTAKPMLVFCPAVAVDLQGARLGMGKGFYDRFFADHPQASRAAVVYQIQVSKDPLPVDKWDQPVDWIVTESMILRTSTTRSP